MRSRRRAEPRPRAVLYLRQSTYREESISLELQEFEGRAYAERRGYDVVAVEADPGISGRTWNRPAVQRVMAMIEEGQADVVVLWKWSRLSRSRLDWAVAADRVETSGGRIESATEPLDTTTSTGRLARGMLTEFAAFESERIGDVWREAHARRLRNGLPATGKPRFGYVYVDGRFEIDPVTGPVLAAAYRRYTAGESIYSLVAWMNEGPARPVEGYGAKSDGLWSARSIRRVFDSGFGAGFVMARGERLDGAHDSLISREEWDAYQEARARRRTYRRTERSTYLLSGLMRCSCGASMTAGLFGANRTPKYRCKAASEKRAHTGGYVMSDYVERFVFEWLIERQQRLEQEAASAPRKKPAPATPTITIQRRLDAVRARLDAATERLVDGSIPNESYQRLRVRYEAEIAGLEEQRTAEVVADRREPIVIIRGVLDRWQDAPVEYRRELLRALIQHVEVTPGRPRARLRIVPR